VLCSITYRASSELTWKEVFEDEYRKEQAVKDYLADFEECMK